MNRKITLAVTALLFTQTLWGEDLASMFKSAKVSGELRSIYMQIDEDNAADSYATAVGGMLKYELAPYQGLSAAVALRTTDNISGLSGEGDEYNSELSGEDKYYYQLSEAYVSYKYKQLLVVFGRQSIDTPLADSDDIRMIPNSFEAYTATYSSDTLSITAGHFDRWQGVDAGLESGWSSTGEYGATYTGLTYEGGIFKVNGWYYNFSNPRESEVADGADTNANDTYYTDVELGIEDQGVKLTMALQYLKQVEDDKSGVEAEIYGASTTLEAGDFELGLSYDESAKKANKHSFSGYGGGTLFAGMDVMILDEITEDRKASSWVASLSYQLKDLNLFYAYGDFKGDANSAGEEAHIIEHNAGFEYESGEFSLMGIYVLNENKEDSSSSEFNNNNFRAVMAYKF